MSCNYARWDDIAASAQRNGFTQPRPRPLKRDVGSSTGGTERLANRRQARKNRTTGGHDTSEDLSVLFKDCSVALREISNAEAEMRPGARGMGLSAQPPLIRALAGTMMGLARWGKFASLSLQGPRERWEQGRYGGLARHGA